MLSVLSMTKVEIPSPRQGKITPGIIFISGRVSRSMVLGLLKNHNTHMALIAWLATVAIAAPRTPIPKPKIRMGSRIILHTAPTTVVIILNLANPCVVIKGFSPITIITKMVPNM